MLHGEVAKVKIETANLTTAVRCISLTDWLLSLLFKKMNLLKNPQHCKMLPTLEHQNLQC